MSETTRHPIQPTVTDAHGVLRFKANAIVRYLLDNGGIDLNHIAAQEFSDEDQRQFAQLIGYSVSGFASLPYVDDVTVEAVERMQSGASSETARADAALAKLASVRESLRVEAHAEIARLSQIETAAKSIIERDREFQEWAQGYLDGGTWAGHDRADAVKQELLAHVDAVSRLTRELEQAKAESVQALARHYGCGEHISFSDAWSWLASRVELSRLAQSELETHKSQAATAEDAMRERFQALRDQTEAAERRLRAATEQIEQLLKNAEKAREVCDDCRDDALPCPYCCFSAGWEVHMKDLLAILSTPQTGVEKPQQPKRWKQCDGCGQNWNAILLAKECPNCGGNIVKRGDWPTPQTGATK